MIKQYHKNKSLRLLLNFVVVYILIQTLFCYNLTNVLALDDEKAARAFKFAKGLFEMQKYDQAASEFKKFLSFYEKSQYSEYALYLLGESYYNSEKYEEAIKAYEEFLKKYKNSNLIDEVYYSLAYSALALNKLNLMNDYFQNLHKSSNEKLRNDALFQSGKYYLQNKNLNLAKKIFQEYLNFVLNDDFNKLSSDEKDRLCEVLYYVGNIYLKENNEDKAKEYYEKFLNYFSNNQLAVHVYYNLGEIFYLKNEYLKAEDFYLKSLKLVEKLNEKDSNTTFKNYFPKLYYSLGWCNYSQNKFQKAVEYYEKCFNNWANFENRPECGLRLGISYFNLKKYDEAIKVLNEVKKIKNLNNNLKLEVEYFLAISLQKKGLLKEATEQFELISKFDSSEIAIESLYNKAVLLFEQKKYEDAILEFNEFLKKFPHHKKSENAFYNIGLAYFNLSKYQNAKEIFINFINKYPNSQFASSCYFNLGEILIIEKNYLEAITWLSKISDNDLLKLESELKICDIYLTLNNKQKLLEKCKEILEKINSLTKNNIKADIVPLLFKLGKNFQILNELKLAILVYKKIVELSNSNYNIFNANFKLIEIYFELNDINSCVSLCEEIIKNFKNNKQYNITEVELYLAKSYITLKKYEEAKTVLNEIIKSENTLDYTKFNAQYELAYILNIQNENQKAIEILENLVINAQDVELISKSHYLLALCYKNINNFEEAIKNLLKIEILYKETSYLHKARLLLLELYIKTNQKRDAKLIKTEILKSNAPKEIKDKANELLKK